MVESWTLWLLLAGVAIGSITVGVALVRLPRDEADVSAAERPIEAGWIAETIERHGGVAPVSFVEEVLDLHQSYRLVARPPAVPRGTPVPHPATHRPIPPAGGPPAGGAPPGGPPPPPPGGYPPPPPPPTSR